MRPVGRRLVKVAVAAIAVAATCLVVVVVLLGVWLSNLDFGFSSSRPKPIAISKQACPYVRAIRTASDAAGASMQMVIFGPVGETPVTEPSVPPSAATLAAFRRLPAQLAALDLSLRVGATKMPARLRRKLEEAAFDVEQGRLAFATDRDPASYFQDVVMSKNDSLVNGVDALAYASDLVGNQCGEELSNYRIGF